MNSKERVLKTLDHQQPDRVPLDLGGWVTITNRSGASYRDTALKLVAGEVHKVKPPLKREYMDLSRMAMSGAVKAPQFEEKAFGETDRAKL